MVVTDRQRELRVFAINVLGIPLGEDTVCIGNVIDGELKAVVAYCNFQGKSCQTHICSIGSNWMTRDFLWAIFDYPFKKLGLKVILAVISGTNEKSLKLSRHLGFEDIAKIADAHEDGDMVIMTMRPPQCRWLNLGVRYGYTI